MSFDIRERETEADCVFVTDSFRCGKEIRTDRKGVHGRCVSLREVRQIFDWYRIVYFDHGPLAASTAFNTQDLNPLGCQRRLRRFNATALHVPGKKTSRPRYTFT